MDQELFMDPCRHYTSCPLGRSQTSTRSAWHTQHGRSTHETSISREEKQQQGNAVLRSLRESAAGQRCSEVLSQTWSVQSATDQEVTVSVWILERQHTLLSPLLPAHASAAPAAPAVPPAPSARPPPPQLPLPKHGPASSSQGSTC